MCISAGHIAQAALLSGALQDIVDNKKLQMRGIIGLYAASAVGDDIEVYKDDTRTEVLCRSVMLCKPSQKASSPVSQACVTLTLYWRMQTLQTHQETVHQYT